MSPREFNNTPSRLRLGRLAATAAAALATLAGSVVVTPLFDSLDFLAPVAIAVLAVAVVGFISRAIGLPVVLHPIATLLGLVTVLTWMYALPAAFLGVLPGPSAVAALRDLIQEGIAQSQVLVAPVPTDMALTALAAGGIGVIAICVDVIGVSIRLPALAGAPLLVLYSLPAAVARDGVAWWLLPIAVVGWLVLLATDTQYSLRRWGRPLRSAMTGSTAKGVGPRAHSAINAQSGSARMRPRGWLAAALAIAVAVTIPAVIPGLDNPVWGSGRGAATQGSGASADSVSIDPFVSLRRNLVNNSTQEVLRMRSDSTEPGYLRLNTLTQFDGVRWSAPTAFEVPLTEVLPPPAVTDSVRTQTIAYEIDIGPLNNPALPVPYAATRVEGSQGPLSDSWTWDPVTRTIMGDGVDSENQQYAVLAERVIPTRAQLRTFTSQDAPAGTTELPGDLTPLVAELAREVTQGATTPYAQATALERWFTAEGGFTYSTAIVGNLDTDPVADFLLERVGYCEQFAAAMALMARSLGIPSRVNVGFTPGQQVGPNEWSVQGRNAHAWPELWFDQIGWVWFEPTPRTETSGGVVAPPYSNTPDRPEPTPTPTGTDEIPIAPDVVIDSPSASNQSGAVSGLVQATVIAVALSALLLGLVLVAAFLIRRIRIHRALTQADPRARIDGAWRELTVLAAAWGWAWPAALTPRQAVASWLRAVNADEATTHELARLLWWVEQARYGPLDVELEGVTTQRLQAALTAIDTHLRSNATVPQRWRAHLRRGRLMAWLKLSHGESWPADQNPWTQRGESQRVEELV